MNLKVKKLILFLSIIFFFGNGIAQKGQIRKANKDFDKYSYIDARLIYLNVVEDGYKSAEIYQKLGDTYYYNSDYTNAAKWYDKLVSEFPDDTPPEYYYRAAQSLKSLGNYTESDALMQRYLESGEVGMVVKMYQDDPNYLKSTVFNSRDFTIEKVNVNSGVSDFGPSFYSTNKVVYATSSGATEDAEIYEWTQQPFLDLFIADMDSLGQLSNSRALEGDMNTGYHESSTAFTKDSSTVYFTRNNFIDGKKGRDKRRTVRLKLYRATRTGTSWGNVVELPFDSKEFSIAHPTLSNDEKRLYFSSDMLGTVGKSDLWYVDILDEDNTYGKPVNLGPEINTEARESFPFISEENKLYFSSDGRSGLGGYDIFVTQLDSLGNPGEVINLGAPANSAQDDFGFIIKEDQRLGYLSSNRGGTNGSIDDDIYLVKENCIITIEGLVTDAESGDILPGADVTLLDENNKLITSTVAKDDGTYSFEADCDTKYTVRGQKEGYLPYETVIQTPTETGTINVPLPLKRIGPCPPNDLGCRLNLQPIYFDFDKSNIRPDAEIELAKILAAMREYKDIVIHIESHTDSRGSDTYNESLSERRAQSTLKWLVGKGIAAERLTAKGYGESQLLNECANGVKCTAEEHQLNRRSMFIIEN